jgi:hypothetical protein
MTDRTAWLLGIVAAVALPLAAHGQDDQARSIVPEAFLKSRPAAPKAAPSGSPRYRRVSRPAAGAATGAVSEIGVTIWKLRPAVAGDITRLLVQDPQGGSVQWTPERVEAGTPLALGDRVRVSVESPRDGYLYVIDREQYADGTSSDPYLIFPTTRARGGDNKVTGGRLVELPAQTDAPPFFTLQASRPNQVAELLTVLISQQPLADVVPGAGPLPLKRETVAAWEKTAGTTVEQLEMVGGAGRAWSAEEQRAGADATRLLTQQDPPPQTVFRVVTTSPSLVAARFTLSHARTRVGSGTPPR